jgi:hypothetical protein
MIDQVKENEIGGACSRYGREKRRIQGFGGKPKRKGPLGRPMCRWEGNIKVDLQEVG